VLRHAPILALFLAAGAGAQVCRVTVSGLNRSRRVIGNVDTECPTSLHTVPFGNYGVTSNYGTKINGNQFQGWCHDTRVCDNSGNCGTLCTDGWYEWNSCTDNPRYRAPNCTLYNAENCTQQVSTQGVNIHGTRTVDVPVRCPAAGGGGCQDMRTFSNGANFMSLYELDPVTGDDLAQTIYFPATSVSMNCTAWDCAAAQSEWVMPSFYDSPAAPARVYAEMSMSVSSAAFVDTSRACAVSPPPAAIVSSASYRAPVAADSLASAFGHGLAPGAAGVGVTVRDAAGVERSATLSYTSPAQVNFLIPAGTALGIATVRFSRSDGIIATATAAVERVAPGLFTDPNLTAAAIAIRVNPGGSQTVLPAGEPIDLSAGDVYLALYGTGVRNHGGIENVIVTAGGERAAVFYAGPQNQYPGLDQINVLLPRTLAGRGTVPVLLSIGGRSSNQAFVRVK
jgi:uncharacterized protein (TIGR03437 family)